MMNKNLPSFVGGGGCCRRTLINLFVSIWLTNDAALVVASPSSTSCNSAISLSAPYSVHQGSVENYNSMTFDAIASLCQSGSFSASNLQAGYWFTYTPSSTTISRAQVEQAAEGGIDLPNMLSLKGPCDSLTCDDDVSNRIAFEDAQAGTQYFIYVFRNSASSGDSPYQLDLDYIETPSNDILETAVAITQQDLPFRGQFNTYGALSDSSQDACAMAGQHGVWFSYMTTLAEESMTVQITSGTQYDFIGIQFQNADGSFTCVGTAVSPSYSIEWTAQANVNYYILVAVTSAEYGHLFQLTLQSNSATSAPTAAVITNLPTLAPATPASTPAPSAAATTSNQGSSSLAPTAMSQQESSSSPRPTSNNAGNDATGLDSNSLSTSSSSSKVFSSPSSVMLGTQVFLGTLGFFFL